MKNLDELKNSRFSRGLFAARSAVRMLPSLIAGENADPRMVFRDLIGKSIEQFVNDVGELKGSVLKAAQILSLYGEYYLPEEVNEVLKKVQSQSHYLGWDRIHSLIPANLKSELDIEETPLAAASIGQVHKAKIKKTGELVVVKIQYPGIKKAIDLDMKMIKTFLSMAKLLPKKMNLDPIYGEIKKVLMEEMDYEHEARKHSEYEILMQDVPGCYVPKLYPEFCSERVIVSEYIDGTPLSTLKGLSQDERNKLGTTLFRLFLQEIFRGHLIQTDGHPGNYLYRHGEVVLIDFGACLTYPEKTLGQYRKLIGELYHGRRANFFAALDEVSGKAGGSFLLDKDLLWKYCQLAASPLKSQDYDWGSTRLPDELYPLAMELVASSRIDTPPHDFIFLDRKILGLFSLLKSLRARFDVSSVSAIYLD
jgi:predicted unusual protein kinase regulating ubiquinone biosynthesis (AarF/ABC1/UbiB family)